MAEEFQESDVLWPEQTYRKEDSIRLNVFEDENFYPAEMIFKYNNSVAASQQNTIQVRRKKSKQSSSQFHSPPVKIPCNWNSNRKRFSSSNHSSFLHYSDSNESEDDLEDAEMVPPHLIVANRFARQMAFSVCTGNGRTLKGRDLRQVRNSILRMTGFLET